MEKSAAGDRLDELYREHPETFVAGRDRLVKELRASGDRHEADRIKKLRRPSAAAWLINRVALDSPAKLAAFSEASRQLEQAQAQALAGKDEGAEKWRAAAARERTAVDAVIEVARRSASDAGHPASERALELVGETLRAATGDPDLRECVLSGRVEREQSAATLGTPTVAPPRRGAAAAGRRREAAEARRELERLEDELSDATEREERLRSQVEQATEILRRDKAKLADAKLETATLKRRLTAAKRRTKAKRR